MGLPGRVSNTSAGAAAWERQAVVLVLQHERVCSAPVIIHTGVPPSHHWITGEPS